MRQLDVPRSIGDHHLILVELEKIVICGVRMEGDSEKKYIFMICIAVRERFSSRKQNDAPITVCISDSGSVNSVTSTLHLYRAYHASAIITSQSKTVDLLLSPLSPPM